MNKSSLSVLAKAVASKRGLTQAEAERFIATMFEVAGAGIQEDKLLKMKWLGTFKITSVKDRESVDVNTGERILIEGRDKISFTPDNILKEIINKPFAQFETVVVNDGVDFSDIDEKFANMEREEELLLQKEQELQLQKEQERHDDEVVLEEQNAEQPQELDQNVRQSREEEQSQENLPDAELQSQENLPDAELQSQENLPDAELQSQENLPDAELQSQENLSDAELQSQENLSDAELQSQENNLSDAELQSQENLSDAKLQSQDDGEKNDLSQESLLNEELTQENNQKVEQPQEVKSPISEENVALSSELKNVETSADDFSETYASDRHHLVIPKYVVALVCVVFVALLGGLCWFAFTYGKMQARQEQMEMQLKAIKPQPQPKPKPTVVAPVDTAKSVVSSDDKTDAENAQANGAQANNAQADHAQLAMKKKAKQDSIRMAQANNAVKMAEKASEYLNDPRIRTGAYRIVGVEKTVTAKSGQTLAGLSKLYLGPGMECYMQAINGCSEIKTGQKVKVPKLELKRKGKKN